MTVLCSVVKHLSSGLESTQEEGRNTRLRLVFRPTLLQCSSRFLRALKLHEQSTVKASLVVNYNYNFSSFQSKTDSNTTIAPKTASCPVIRFFGFCWTQLAFFQLFIRFITQTTHSCPSETASYEEFKPPSKLPPWD